MKNVMLCLALAVFVMVPLAGCQSGDKVTADSIRWDLADDLHTPALTREETDNRIFHTMTVNLRKLDDEVVRLLLLDRPSRGFNYPSILE